MLLFGSLRQELTPPEDRALALLSITAPQGVALDYTDAKMREIEALIEPLRASGEVPNVFAIVGQGGSDSRGFMVMSLADWADARRAASRRSWRRSTGSCAGSSASAPLRSSRTRWASGARVRA